MKATPEQIDEYSRMAIERGGTVHRHVVEEPEEQPKRRTRVKPKLVEPLVEMDDSLRTLRLEVPMAIRSEANGREWRKRSGRTQSARLKVRETLAQRTHYLGVFEDRLHDGKPIQLRFVKLGGRAMDHSNLPAAFKACEDAIAYLIGWDDGSPLWRPTFAQEPGGDSEGVRIEISMAEDV